MSRDVSAELIDMSDLPEGWRLKPLKQVTRPSKVKVDPRQCPDKPYLSLEHIESETTKLLGRGTASDVRSTKAVFNAGDVLYGRLRPYLNKVARPDFDGVASTDILVFPPQQGLDQRYLLRFLNSATVVDHAHHHSMGLQMPRIGFEVLGDIPIPLPPIHVQEKIADILENLIDQVDSAKDRLAAIPALLKKFRQSVLAAACSGQLTADWREENPNASGHDLLARIAAMESGKSRAATHLEDLELSETPETWAWSTFATLTVNHDGKRKPVKSSDRKDMKGEYRYYGASGVIDYVNDYLFDGSYLLISEDGANLESRTTPIAFQAHGQFWVNNHAHIVQTKAGCPLGFLEFYIESLDLRDYLSGSAQPKLTQAALNSLPVPVPPKDEQVEIVRRIESLFALADSIESRLADATAQVERTTQAILAKAFRGELTGESDVL